MKNYEDFAKECPLVAILRGITPQETAEVGEALYRAGFRLMEIPLNTPDALACIRIAAERFHGDGRMLVGAGTVLTPSEVKAVAAAGGRFIISPNTDADVIRATVQSGLVSIPGFATPSEGFAALKAGANYLKLFPAGAFGTGYIKDIKAVIKAPIMAVGGVSRDNLADFLTVCCGAGIGSSLYKPGKSVQGVEKSAAEFVALCRK